jgi:hypothetical protein
MIACSSEAESLELGLRNAAPMASGSNSVSEYIREKSTTPKLHTSLAVLADGLAAAAAAAAAGAAAVARLHFEEGSLPFWQTPSVDWSARSNSGAM